MKTIPLVILSSAIILASCSSSKYTASSEYDDIYYNPNKVERQATKAATTEAVMVSPQETMTAQPINQEPVYTAPVAVVDENLSDYELYKLQQEAEMLGEVYAPEGSEALYAEQYVEYDTLSEYGLEAAPVIVNNYNYYSDPNDYYYSSNLRRFSDEYYGWNYYDPYYTDMYFYTGNPWSWGISMGWGYPGWRMRSSYGYPYYGGGYYGGGYYGGGYYGGGYYGMGWGGYYDPWYSWGYGGYPYYGGSYWSGYNHGYYNGYYGNDYSGSANYRYGRMDNRHYYGYSRPSSVSSGSSKTSTVGDARYRSRGTTASKSATATRSTSAVNTSQRQVRSTNSTGVQRNTNGTVRTTRTRQQLNVQPQSRTVKSSGTNATSNRRTYTPSYSKPRTSSASSYNKAASQSRTYTQPATQSRTNTYNRSTNTPSRSSSSYSRPSSSSRSSSSYSRPSSSSRSSGSVSRSSGGSSRSSGSVSRSSGGSSRSSGSVSRSSGGSSRSSGSSGGSSRSSGSSSRR